MSFSVRRGKDFSVGFADAWDDEREWLVGVSATGVPQYGETATLTVMEREEDNKTIACAASVSK
jgi:hypothetical protein